MQPKPSAERRSRYHHPVQHGQHHGRMLAARYLELGRQPRLHDLPRRRPPYLEATVTAAAFIYLLYLVLGGA